MVNSEQGWQYPQPPMYPQGPMVPGSMVQSTRPAAMRRADQATAHYETVSGGATGHAAPGRAVENFDIKRAESVLPLMAQLLGLKAP